MTMIMLDIFGYGGVRITMIFIQNMARKILSLPALQSFKSQSFEGFIFTSFSFVPTDDKSKFSVNMDESIFWYHKLANIYNGSGDKIFYSYFGVL